MLKPVEAVLQLEWFIPNLLEGGADRGRSAADFFRNRYFTGNFYRGGKKSWGWEYFLTKKATANDASMGGGDISGERMKRYYPAYFEEASLFLLEYMLSS